MPTYFEQGILSRSGETIAPLGPNLMGDAVNEYSGGLSFSHTDVSLPGNNALPVAVGRVLATGTRQAALGTGLFGDWDLDIPRLHTVALQNNPNWYGGNGFGVFNQNRCTQFQTPPISTYYGGNRTNNLRPESWWDGHHMYVPGAGDQTLLGRAGVSPTSPIQPTDGGAYPVLTKQHWQVSCLPTLERGTGEGFVARAPDGTRYQFDHMVQRAYPGLSMHANGTVARLEIWILPTQITDRFGNWVRYSYGGADGWRVNSITSSDGRSITFTYSGLGNRIQSINDGTRTWTYGYDAGGALQTVTQPDGAQWQFALTGLEKDPFATTDPGCGGGPGNTWDYSTPTGTMTHPSGAVGTFGMKMVRHGRSNVPGTEEGCEGPHQVNGINYVNMVPRYFINYALASKTLSGPGMPAMTWNYAYTVPGTGCFAPCVGTKTVTITDPLGNTLVNTYGTQFGVNDGLLLTSVVSGSSGSLRTTNYLYRAPGAGPYPVVVGANGGKSDSMSSIYTPQSERSISQQGVTFTQSVTAFDIYARPTALTRGSTLGYSRTESTIFFDQTSIWALGQVNGQTVAGQMVSATSFYPATALPSATYKFGKLQNTFGFNPDGTLAVIVDGLGQATSFSNYLRGLPQTIAYADSTSVSAVVNNIGAITSATNESGATWTYGYDPMGRLSRKTPPPGDAVAYNPTTLSFLQLHYEEAGLAIGHWRQIITTGSAVTINYFDARWRVRVTITYDEANPSGTQRMQRFDYDPYNRKTFAAYPARYIASYTAATPGTTTTYDALGRPTQTAADSELGPLTTTTQYLANFQTRTTNPRGFATTTAYQAFDEPTESAIVAIYAPEGQTTSIGRDAFHKPLSITRGGNYGGAQVSMTRSYVYDANQLLCKSVDPEVGATIQSLDAAGNVAWRATGLTTLTSTGSCDTASVPGEAKVAYTYDLRNRLTGTGFGDGSPAIGRSYTADGLPLTVVSNDSAWTYSYNNRRLLTRERLVYGQTYDIYRGYDANGHQSQLTYPGGTVVAYAPNALGEATQVSGYASGVSYHPNGAVAGYTLANGLVHSLTQNTRGLPLVNRDAGVLQDQYSYDANGNIAAIADQMPGGVSSRAMGYDGLDRLTGVNAPSMWGAATYGYDPLDNMMTSVVQNRSTIHNYDRVRNRLDSINTWGAYTSYVYDGQGNISGRASAYASVGFYFDRGNRLSLANPVSSFAYDGHGRRVGTFGSNGVNATAVYSLSGQLLHQLSQQGMMATSTRYVYLAGKLIAETNASTGATSYAHTDALGSPVARSDALANVTTRTNYEAYGNTFNGTVPASIGFTGHVNDPDTGLVYMQQRYYDPIAARFMSVDPVVTDAETGKGFGLYTYVDNNPYAKVDPDGRIANFVFGAIIGGGIEVGFQLANGGAVKDWTAVGVAAGVGALTGGVGGIAAKFATTGAISAGQAVAATAAAGGLAAAAGKNVEAGLKGESVTSTEVAVSAAAGALGSAVGGKLATKMIGAAEKAAASSDNVVSGIGKSTLGAIRQGGSTSSVTTGASEVTQKAADVATGAAGKKIENATK